MARHMYKSQKISLLKRLDDSKIKRLMTYIASLALLSNICLAPTLAVNAVNSEARVGTNLVVPEKLASPPPAGKPAKINKGPKTIQHFKAQVKFSANPKDVEITYSRVLPEPLLPSAASGSKPENKALANALLAYKNRTLLESIASLTSFISTHPNSRWRAALEHNLGLIRYQYGYLSDALKYWQSAWDKCKDLNNPQAKTIAEESGASLALLQAKLGYKEELQKLLTEIDKRGSHGSAELRVREAHQGLSCMQHHPEYAYKCGPYAVRSVITVDKKVSRHQPLVDQAKSTDKGTSLASLKELTDKLGIKYQMAKRNSGAPFIVPSVMHWKVGHFAAIIAKKKGKYQIKDPTFGIGNNLWISSTALEAETDGYFLVPAGQLPPGWHSISAKEANKVWGRGAAGSNDQGKTPYYPKNCPQGSGSAGGMASASVFTAEGTLNIMDIPVGYMPPRGPSINFLVNYNYLEGNQPGTFGFPNFGADWSLNWVSYMTLDSSNNATISVRGGGYEQYAYVNPDNVTNPYAPNLMSQAVLSVPQAGEWYRNLPDGSIEVFSLGDSSGRIYMTAVVDPQGNTATITYDSNFRITAITDAIAQASTITYVSNTLGNAGFYKIAQIADPFGRFCKFHLRYDNHLFNIYY